MNPDGNDLRCSRAHRNSVGFDFIPRPMSCGSRTTDVTISGTSTLPIRSITPHGGGCISDTRSVTQAIWSIQSLGAPVAVARSHRRRKTLGPHVAALGMRFYTGDMFPERYRGQIFIAEHGSWNRSPGAGHTG